METIKQYDDLSQIIEFAGKKYKCMNLSKFKRVIYGLDDSGDPRVKGVGEKASPQLILAAYDRVGGYIQNEEGFKVINGCFANYRESRGKEAKDTVIIKEPVVMLEANMKGVVYEWQEGESVPWAELVNQPEKKRGEKNKRVRVTPTKKVETKKVEDELPVKQPKEKDD